MKLDSTIIISHFSAQIICSPTVTFCIIRDSTSKKNLPSISSVVNDPNSTRANTVFQEGGRGPPPPHEVFFLGGG